MSLTPQQQKFLDTYVRKHSIKGKGKQKRAEGFSTLREQVNQALASAPPLLPDFQRLVAAMKAADALGDQLKFDRAATAMQQVLADIKAAVKTYRPPVDPGAQRAADPAELAKVRRRHNNVVTDRAWQAQQGRSGIGGDLKILQYRASALLGNDQITAPQLKQAAGLVDEMEVKRKFLLGRAAEIEKRRQQLRKYSRDITGDANLYPNADLEPLIQEAHRLAEMDGRQWTPTDETAATSAYLDMMMVLAERDQVHQKDFKEGTEAMVMALRRKEKLKPGRTDGALESNFKLVLKPVDREIAVDGFKKGGGAPREAMGGVIGDKLQEMLGLELNVAKTKLVQVDGGSLKTGNAGEEDNGYAKGQKVTASVQAFVRDGKSIEELADEQLEASLGRKGKTKAELNETAGRILDQLASKEDIHQMAVFDLIALHADRHCGNFMIGADRKLVPIDHGNVMPTREGLRGRRVELGPEETVLGNTAAVKEKLAPEMADRLERLNIDELVSTMRRAQQDMVAANPDVDAADLDAGLDNVRRSAEFMKFAARQLTLEQIYRAYSMCQDHIFFSDETQKLQGFAYAVEAMRDGDQIKQRLAVLLGEDPGTESGILALVKRIKALGWLARSPLRGTVAAEFVTTQALRCVRILDGNLAAPTLPTDDAALLQALGGDAALARLGYGNKDMGRIDKIMVLEGVLATTGQMP